MKKRLMNELKSAPRESARAMLTVELITNSFKRYLDQNTCECIPADATEELDQFSSELLDHVIVVGGFCRDVLLNRKINDIDIIINLRELTKLQTNHLKKYHQKRDQQGRDCRCAYWKRYLAKTCPHAGKINEEQKHNPEIQMMHNINYILNAKFWINILKNDNRFENCLSVHDEPKKGFLSCEIVNTLKHGDMDLNGQRIDIIDTFHVDRSPEDHDMFDDPKIQHYHRKSRQLSMSGMDIERMGDAAMQTVDFGDDANGTPGGFDDDDYKGKANKSRPEVDTEPKRGPSNPRSRRLKSIQIQEPDMAEMGGVFGNFGMKGDEDAEDYIALEVPIYSGKVRYKLLNYDFSINTCILPLSNVIRLIDYNNNYNHSINGNQDNQPLTWRDVIENGLGECDGMEDAQQEGILRSPEHDHCTIEAHPVTFIFWRIVRWMIRENGFTVDEKLRAAVIKDFQNWLSEDWMGKEENRTTFLGYLKKTLEAECSSIADVEQMMTVMDDLRFHEKFIPLLNSMPELNNSLVDTLSQVENSQLLNQKIAQIFEMTPFNYPKLPVASADPSGPSGKIKALERKIEELEKENAKKEDWALRLENQSTRLLEDKKKLQEQLKRTNNELEQSKLDYNALKDSKEKLATSTNNTINELRAYLLKYQKAVLEAKVATSTQ